MTPPDLADLSLWMAACALGIAGLVRGFSGFGGAMIFVPVASALYSPSQAVATIFLVDMLVSAPLTLGAMKHCQWRPVLTLLAGAALTVPAGVWLLIHLDPILLRWGISGLILAAVALLAAGWRYTKTPGVPMTLAIGGSSGLMSGLASLGGPPAALFWLSGNGSIAGTRANMLAFSFLNGISCAVAFAIQGLFTEERLAFAAVLAPVYVLAIYSGAHLFRFARDRFYRRLALTLCAASALVSLPFWGSGA